ncbi:MAG: MarR family transcriptional regulator [Ignavibacteriaceae bacterium]
MGESLKKRLKQTRFNSPEQEAMLNLTVTGNFLKFKHEAICNKFGITGPQYNVLRILKGAYPEGYARCDIISRMLEPAPDVTRLIDRLINEGLVKRYNSPDDRRLSLAKITSKGISLLDKMKPDIEQFELLIGKYLTKEETIQISVLCEKIYGHEV